MKCINVAEFLGLCTQVPRHLLKSLLVVPCPILPFPRPIRTFLSFQINSGVKSGPRYNFKTERSTETKWTQIMNNKEENRQNTVCAGHWESWHVGERAHWPPGDLGNRQGPEVWVGEVAALLWQMHWNCINVIGEMMEVKMDGSRWPVPSLGHRLGSKLLSYFHIF